MREEGGEKQTLTTPTTLTFLSFCWYIACVDLM